MTMYQLLPTPTNGRGEHLFTTWNDAFSTEEIEKIIKIGDSLQKDDAKIATGVDPSYRRSRISWIELNSETEWIFNRLGGIISSINSQFYGFNIYGFAEGIQYTVYNSEDEGCYDWHLDWGNKGPQRKLSIVVQLSDPEDYEGGFLEVMNSKNPEQVDKVLGKVAVFPSFTLHRVTPVTKGTRKTLVAWICGEQFK